MLASASGATVVGFNVRPNAEARTLAEREGVEIRTYRVIYQLTEDIEQALVGMLKPVEKEETLGEAEVRALFKVSRLGTLELRDRRLDDDRPSSNDPRLCRATNDALVTMQPAIVPSRETLKSARTSASPSVSSFSTGFSMPTSACSMSSVSW